MLRGPAKHTEKMLEDFKKYAMLHINGSHILDFSKAFETGTHILDFSKLLTQNLDCT